MTEPATTPATTPSSSAPAPVVELARVHGRDSLGSGGRARGRLYDLSVSLQAGIHAFLGRPRDGTTALCELIAGRAHPRSGRVLVSGRAPWRSPALRRRIGAYLARPALVDMGRVRDVLAAASSFRGTDAVSLLGELGLDRLVDRRLTSLHQHEARALELVLALAVHEPLAVVLDEPLDVTELVPRAVLVERLSAMAAGGAAVIVTSAIPSDVEGLADHVHLLDRGRLLGSDRALGWPGGQERELMLWLRDVADARRLATALGEAPSVTAVAWEGREGEAATVTVRAVELADAAVAVAAVVARTGIDLVGMQPVAPTLESLHAVRRARAAKEAIR